MIFIWIFRACLLFRISVLNIQASHAAHSVGSGEHAESPTCTWGPLSHNVTFENSLSLIRRFYIRYLISSSHLSYEQDYDLHLTDEEMEIQRQ